MLATSVPLAIAVHTLFDIIKKKKKNCNYNRTSANCADYQLLSYVPLRVRV